MPMSAVQTVVDGVLLHEVRDGAETILVPDTLGSVVQTRDASGNRTWACDYWPYGEERGPGARSANPWRFVGTLGYRAGTPGSLYVRARWYRPGLARWQTVDPVWPDSDAFVYCFAIPIVYVDLAGAYPVKTPLRPPRQEVVNPLPNKPPSWLPREPSPQNRNSLPIPRPSAGVLLCLMAIIQLNLWSQGEEEGRRENQRRFCDDLNRKYKRLCGDFRAWIPCDYGMSCAQLKALTEKYKLCFKKRQEFKKVCVQPLLWDKGHEYPINLAKQYYGGCLGIYQDIC